jgi:hypothetical protein
MSERLALSVKSDSLNAMPFFMGDVRLRFLGPPVGGFPLASSRT